MSFAYKLWKIGSVLAKEDVFELMNENAKIPNDPDYLNINFIIENEKCIDIDINRNSVSKNDLFLTSKIGGTSNAYYLYPNIVTGKKDSPIEKIKNLENTLKESGLFFANDKNKIVIQIVLKNLEKAKDKLKEIERGQYVFFISINNETIYKLMPEIWGNWFLSPFINEKNITKGKDVFTNIECEVGYSTDVKIFSYDNYHDSFNYRISKNYALSKESAKNIKFGWLYCMRNLFFRYKYKEYCILPNMINFDKSIYKKILNKFKSIKESDKNRETKLKEFKIEEEKLEKQLKKIKKQEKENELKNKLECINNSKEEIDQGLIKKTYDEIEKLEDFKDMVILDYYFLNLNRTNKSFQIKGSIEDIIPSRIRYLVEQMNEFKIDDNITYKYKGREGYINLKNFFIRRELEIFRTKKFKGLNDMENIVLQDRIYLAKLLLTDQKIKFEDLLKRFEYHREYDYEGKKRIKDGVKSWVGYSNSFRKEEDAVINFFKVLDKIKE